MKDTFFARPEDVALARKIERTLLDLSLDSGIVFVGVEVIKQTHPTVIDPMFRIFIGCRREFDPGLMDHIARHALRELVPEPERLIVQAKRGVERMLRA